MFPFFKKTCYFCKKKVKNSEVYLGEKQKNIHVCRLCKAYAERRAYRKA